MKRLIEVPWGEVMAGKGEVILNSTTDNECLVIAAYDAAKKIGCLAHAVFTDPAKLHRSCVSVMRNLTDAIDEMIKDMIMLGSDQNNIEVALVAGENVPHKKDDPKYNGRIDHVMEILAKRHIKCRQDRICDIGTSHVGLDVSSGEILVQ